MAEENQKNKEDQGDKYQEDISSPESSGGQTGPVKSSPPASLPTVDQSNQAKEPAEMPSPEAGEEVVSTEMTPSGPSKGKLALGILIGLVIGVVVVIGGYFGWQALFPPAEEEVPTTGSLIIYSQPSGAQILLDSEDTFKNTPATFTNLNPGQYTVTLMSETTYSWDVAVKVKAGQTAEVRGILVEKSPPEETQ